MRLSPSALPQCLPLLSTSARLRGTCGRTGILQRSRSGPQNPCQPGRLVFLYKEKRRSHQCGNWQALLLGIATGHDTITIAKTETVRNAGGGSLERSSLFSNPRLPDLSHIEAMSPALWFPFRGLTRLSHPGKTARRVSAAKSIPDKSLNKTPKPALTSLGGSSSEKIRFSNT